MVQCGQQILAGELMLDIGAPRGIQHTIFSMKLDVLLLEIPTIECPEVPETGELCQKWTRYGPQWISHGSQDAKNDKNE